MPLVVICGQPSSGKSSVAQALKTAFEVAAGEKRLVVQVINEGDLHLSASEAYKDAVSEKNTRGLLRSTVDRAVTKDKVVIVDSLNNIKGYRYELWCIGRAAATKYCMVHCDVSIETARAWNSARDPAIAYQADIFEDLAGRFERPEGRNRWDAPLFTVKPDQEEVSPSSPVVQEIVAAMLGTATASGQASRNLQPTIATQAARVSDTNLLYELDRATQEVVSCLMDAQTAAGGSWAGTVNLGDGVAPIRLTRAVGLPELRRLRRTFLKLATQTAAAPPPDAATARRLFADYLVRELSHERD